MRPHCIPRAKAAKLIVGPNLILGPHLILGPVLIPGRFPKCCLRLKVKSKKFGVQDAVPYTRLFYDTLLYFMLF